MHASTWQRWAGGVGLAAIVLVGCDPAPPDNATATAGASDTAQSAGATEPVPDSQSTALGAPSSAATSPTASPSGQPSSSLSTSREVVDEPTLADPAGWEIVAEGFDAPVATVVDPRTGDLLVVQQPGRISRLDGTVVLDLSDRVTAGGERGLLDATITPDGTRVIVHYSGDDGATTLASLAVAGAGTDQLADPSDEIDLLSISQPAGNHNGGSVVFGPDGYLHLALGDGGGGNDTYGNGDNLATPLGAILRLDIDSDPSQALPAPDNPYVDGGGDPRIWVSGVRNPWRITHDGQRWFVADVGQNAVEEVTVVPADAGPHDLGWPAWEGDVCRLDPCDDTSVAPVTTLSHADGACSILGGAVASVPAVDAGTYYFTDLCDRRVWRLDPGNGAVEVDSELPSPALALDLDVDGSVVALTQTGEVLVRTR